MNTTITTAHANVARTVADFCSLHMVDFTVNHTGGLRIIHLDLANPFLVTKLQDILIHAFHSHSFDMQCAVAA